MPGGASWKYTQELRAEGAQRIRQFVNGGGAYFGICGGAYYATTRRQGGFTTATYGIGLLDGVAYDGTSLSTPPFKVGILDFEVSSDSLLDGLPTNFSSLLLGGPAFHFSPAEARRKQIEVLMSFAQTDEPAAIFFHYGLGKVFLAGPHLEIEEDRTDWGPNFYDAESDWPILSRVIDALVS
jgi:glutamine amidotransferase-like uncharacterized protein